MPLVEDKTCPSCGEQGEHLGSDENALAVYLCHTDLIDCRVVQYKAEYADDETHPSRKYD